MVNIGKVIQDMETDMRSNMNQLHVLKTREVVNSIRKLTAARTANLSAAIFGHGKTRKIDSEA